MSKEKFDKAFTELNKSKKIIYIPTQAKCEEMIEIIQQSSNNENEKKKLSKDEFNLLGRYSVRIEQTMPVLYHSGDVNENPKQVIAQEKLFYILQTSHEKLGHAGVNVMWHELRNYYGISKDFISLFLKDCHECELKRGKAKKGIVIRPILSQEQNSRCQVDLIDLQSCPADGFNHIMVYQDHLTKFIVLSKSQSQLDLGRLHRFMQANGSGGDTVVGLWAWEMGHFRGGSGTFYLWVWQTHC